MTKARDDLSTDYVKAIFDYDEESGILRWEHRADMPPQWNGKFPGRIAGTVNDRGYVLVAIYGKDYRAHRIIWAIKTGRWPEHEIDHENTVKSDNRWFNLRQATHAQNNCNKGPQSNNKSGYKGVSWCRIIKAWVASIRHHGVTTKLGYRDDPEDAHELYKTAAIEMHGEFHNPGGL